MNQNGNWYESANLSGTQDYYLVLTHDTDSLLSCNYLTNKFGIAVGGFLNYKKLFLNSKFLDKRPIYVDCDLVNGMCYGNHFTLVENPNAVNMNNGVKEYHKKYAGSTIITLFSLYEDTLDGFTDEQFFRFRNVWDYWVDTMGINRLTKVLSGYSRKDILKIIDKYQLKCPVGLSKYNTLYWNGRINDIYNDFGIDISIPKGTFNILDKEFDVASKMVNELSDYDIESMFSNV